MLELVIRVQHTALGKIPSIKDKARSYFVNTTEAKELLGMSDFRNMYTCVLSAIYDNNTTELKNDSGPTRVRNKTAHKLLGGKADVGKLRSSLTLFGILKMDANVDYTDDKAKSEVQAIQILCRSLLKIFYGDADDPKKRRCEHTEQALQNECVYLSDVDISQMESVSTL